MEAITLIDLFNAGFEQNKGLILKIFNSNKRSYFWKACSDGCLELIKFMVENGADIQENNNYPIQLTSYSGHLEVVKFLIDRGGDVKANNNWAIRHASQYGHFEIVKLLIEHGADVKTQNNYAVALASTNGHLEVVKLLIEHGADVKADNNYSIRHASQNGHLEVVKVLLAHGAEVTDEIINNAKDNVKEYLKSIKNIVYYGFVSKGKLDIKLPELLEINKNNQYYYVYQMIHDHDQEKEASYYLEGLLDKQKILLSLTNNNVDSLRTFVKI